MGVLQKRRGNIIPFHQKKKSEIRYEKFDGKKR
jgi:hypothetical protein